MEAWRGAPSLAHSLAERRLSCLALFPLELGPRSGANGVTTTHRLRESSSGDVGRRDVNLISEVQPLFNMRRVRGRPPEDLISPVFLELRREGGVSAIDLRVAAHVSLLAAPCAPFP